MLLSERQGPPLPLLSLEPFSQRTHRSVALGIAVIGKFRRNLLFQSDFVRFNCLLFGHRRSASLKRTQHSELTGREDVVRLVSLVDSFMYCQLTTRRKGLTLREGCHFGMRRMISGKHSRNAPDPPGDP